MFVQRAWCWRQVWAVACALLQGMFRRGSGIVWAISDLGRVAV
jgi:hypothetical protein